ncbi:TIGR01777 family oxidoreductase [Staphylococcus intermedius]|uniref:NAD dependent epimerase/dehydratase family protein n=1 Tax=Staphylococcus intermedius NCTC 11048 TaxID=1141106 RepID=A0A380GAJ5_STAIN|nr:TIGR01777 family oxidoreductase [Staphylococcus intermedius]PCF65426.1 TIGR01777 family protein [Staphylococcus intermedius]PCF81104.1 TIGR01777 family protein [Staphylococcus intermedius]PCF82386.1 TIGR01777 family protein [Staphylococcus intermedius]PCF87087.1 TIGR01777 family protein [Staphylococcus intermedius]PCF87645.1 TIGR01777 family protein [Staphylococcus intermedius]
MKHYLITGGTGMVGSALVEQLTRSNENIIHILTRSDKTSQQENVHYINWNNDGWEAEVPHIDIVINLAGATLNQRWTPKHQQLMMTSRIQATRALFDFFEQREQKPDVLFNASAMGYYPPSENTVYTETYQTTPHDLLSEIVYQWERQATRFQQLGTRVICGRFGLILSRNGGALPMMSLPYRFFVGGRIGNGRQWYSWIHVSDLVHAIQFLIQSPEASGPFNLSAPAPETQQQFGKVLGNVMHRPHYTWVPAWFLRFVLGKMSTLVLDTQYMLPQKIVDLGFQFEYPTLSSALKDLYSK